MVPVDQLTIKANLVLYEEKRQKDLLLIKISLVLIKVVRISQKGFLGHKVQE